MTSPSPTARLAEILSLWESGQIGCKRHAFEDLQKLATSLAQERDSLAEQLAAEREGREGAERTIKRLIAKVQRDQGYVAVSDLLRFVSAACESCDGSGEVMSADTVTSLTCGTCRGSGQHPSPPQGGPPLHPCKRCGKPVQHPAQEYCGAECSVQRNRPVEQSTSTASPETKAEDPRLARIVAVLTTRTWQDTPRTIAKDIVRELDRGSGREDFAAIVGRMRERLHALRDYLNPRGSAHHDALGALDDLDRLEKAVK